jgi:hypothetical protein
VPVPLPVIPERTGDAAAPHSHGRGDHRHLWCLLDGTLAHAPPGRLTYNADGQVACHLCGRWFTHLGAHLRKHGWSAADYRAAVGLALHRPLCSLATSARISKRQKANWESNPTLRDQFEPGRGAARSGALAQMSVRATRQRRQLGTTPPEVTWLQREQLSRGRGTTAQRRHHHRAAVVAAAGHVTLGDYLRDQYFAGASLDDLARALRLGRAALREALREARVPVRASGRNTTTSKRARATRNDGAVATRVGTHDLPAWLRNQHHAGHSLAALAAMTGRSVPWVRSRLAGTSINEQRASAHG